jgi:hypothetical protein
MATLVLIIVRQRCYMMTLRYQEVVDGMKAKSTSFNLAFTQASTAILQERVPSPFSSHHGTVKVSLVLSVRANKLTKRFK